MVKIGSKTERKIKDYKLSRYACYLIVQNADPRKQELAEKDYSMLTEDEKRFYQRSLTKKGNYSLNQAAKKAVLKTLISFIMPAIKAYIMVRQRMTLLKEKA